MSHSNPRCVVRRRWRFRQVHTPVWMPCGVVKHTRHVPAPCHEPPMTAACIVPWWGDALSTRTRPPWPHPRRCIRFMSLANGELRMCKGPSVLCLRIVNVMYQRLPFLYTCRLVTQTPPPMTLLSDSPAHRRYLSIDTVVRCNAGSEDVRVVA